MKTLLFFPFLICLTGILNAQNFNNDTMTFVTTVGILDPRETKSGYQINEYYIALSSKQVKLFAGKTIEVKGTVMVVEGIDPNEKIKTQGSESNRLFILEPTIRVLKE